MRFNIKLVIASLVAAMIPSTLAYIDGPCDDSYYGLGACMRTQDCTKGSGSYIDGYCKSDPANVKCCVKKVKYGSRVGHCIPRDQCKGASIVEGYCPGGKNVILCV